jgi:cell division protein FtsQ
MKRKILLIGIWSLLIIMMMVVLGMAVQQHQNSRCREVRITINNPGGDVFITEKEIRTYMQLVDDSLEGERLGKIDIHQLEQLISSNPYVLTSQVYASLDGIVHIDVIQRKPVVRVQNAAHEQWYISDDGHMMPLNPGKSARVLLASGFINEVYAQQLALNPGPIVTKEDSAMSKTLTYGIFKIASYIDKDAFLKAQIEQIYVNKAGEFELVPMVGKQLIMFGDATNVETKFQNLVIFYKQGLSTEGWDTYDTINLKFENQVVCTIK